MVNNYIELVDGGQNNNLQLQPEGAPAYRFDLGKDSGGSQLFTRTGWGWRMGMEER